METPTPDRYPLGGRNTQFGTDRGTNIGTDWHRMLKETVRSAEAEGFARAFVGPLTALRGHGSVGGAVPAPKSLISAQLEPQRPRPCITLWSGRNTSTGELVRIDYPKTLGDPHRQVGAQPNALLTHAPVIKPIGYLSEDGP